MHDATSLLPRVDTTVPTSWVHNIACRSSMPHLTPDLALLFALVVSARCLHIKDPAIRVLDDNKRDPIRDATPFSPASYEQKRMFCKNHLPLVVNAPNHDMMMPLHAQGHNAIADDLLLIITGMHLDSSLHRTEVQSVTSHFSDKRHVRWLLEELMESPNPQIVKHVAGYWGI